MTETISRYVNAWNERTPESITAAFLECCSLDITYTDRQTPSFTDAGTPLVKGITQLTALVMDSHTKIPGRTFSVQTVPQYFDGHCHYSWGLHLPSKQVLAGWDYILYNEENLITQIVGFLPEQP